MLRRFIYLLFGWQLVSASKNETLEHIELAPDDFINAMALSDDSAADAWFNGTEEDPILAAGKFEGDINLNGLSILSYVDDFIIGDPNATAPPLRDDNAIRGIYKKWPGGKIYYQVSRYFNARERSVISAAIQEYEKYTCVQWLPRYGQRDFVYIIKGRGCHSQVGRSGGMQYLSLGYNCVHKGIAIHEMMHAAGFFHEQSRADRDEHISINWNYIMYGTQGNFNKYSLSVIDHLGTGYDYDSIMHYGRTAFTKWPGYSTIVPKKRGAVIGQRRGLSETDIVKLNKLYSCPPTSGKTKKKKQEKTSLKTTIEPTASTTSPTPRPVTVHCSDFSPHCGYWARTGWCSRNTRYMHSYCKQSCGKCNTKGSCVDVNPYCSYWARRGECQRFWAYMGTYCARSCGKCRSVAKNSCLNTGQHCVYWAKMGYCSHVNYRLYMSSKCKRSCGKC